MPEMAFLFDGYTHSAADGDYSKTRSFDRLTFPVTFGQIFMK